MDPGPTPGWVGCSAMSDVIRTIAGAGVLPVVTINDAANALPLASALAAGGLHLVEVTLRTDAGIPAIQALASERPTMCVGAGSVTTAAKAAEAVAAGAQFLVSPGFDEGVVSTANELGVPVIPGIATPTELMRAIDHGLGVVKLFPAESVGGVRTLRALSSVWPDVRFVPTGGISAANAADYLADGHVLAVGGSWVAPPALIGSGEWAQITELAAAAVDLVRSAR